MADNRGIFLSSGENAIEWLTGIERATVTFSSRRHITRIRRLAAAHPEAVEIIREPEHNDGYLYARIPASWIRINPPKEMNYTEEQREAIGERLKVSKQRIQ